MLNFRKNIGLAAGVVSIVLLTSCSGGGNASDTAGKTSITVVSSGEPQAFDPQLTGVFTVADLGRAIFETLLTTDDEGHVKPMIAESYDVSEDGTVYTFHLRNGLKFQDGSDLTADDVVDSMTRWTKKTGPGTTFFPGAVWTKNDDETVTLKVTKPSFQHLLQLSSRTLNSPAILPSEVIKKAGDKPITDYIGSGPYTLSEWSPGQRMVLKAWDGYQARKEPADGQSGNRTPNLKEIDVAFVTDPSTATQGLITGQYDVLLGTPYDGLSQIKADQNLNTYTGLPTLEQLIFSTKKAGPLSNVKLRQAINVGLDRDAIMRSAVGSDGQYELTHHIMSKFQENVWNTDVGRANFNSHDLEAAKRMIAESGYHGEEIKLLITKAYPDAYNASIAVEDQFRKMGLNVKLDAQDWSTFVQKAYEAGNDWDALIVPNSPQAEPSSVWGFISGAPGNPGTDEINALLADFNSSKTLDAARAKYDGLQQWREDQRWVIRLGDALSHYSSQKSVKPLPRADRTTVWWQVGYTENASR